MNDAASTTDTIAHSRFDPIASFEAGRVRVVIRSNRVVYVTDSSRSVDHEPKIVATTSAGCQAVAEALLEAAAVMRSSWEEGTEAKG